MLTLEKILHKSKDQILIKWNYRDDQLAEKIKNIANMRYSKTFGGFYLPFNSISVNILKSLGEKITFVQEKTPQTSNMEYKRDKTEHKHLVVRDKAPAYDASIPDSKDQETKILYNNGNFYVSFAFDRNKINSIKKLDRAYWAPKQKCWVCKGTRLNLENLQMLLEYWDTATFSQLIDIIRTVEFPKMITLYQVPESKKYIALKLEGHDIDVNYIKNIFGRVYEREYQRWLIPYDEKTIKKLIAHYTKKSTDITNRLPKSKDSYHEWETSFADKQKALISKYPAEVHELLSQYTHVMITQRYSWSTVISYSGAIVRFQQFMGQYNVAEGEAKDVNRFLAQISSKKVSYNEINRHCSAIKFYYEKVLYRPDFEIDHIKRPRSSNTLPKVLSKDQIKLMFEQVENQKHLCMLFLLYNGGLRSGELIKVRMQDIMWDRSQLFIEGAKGKKDRVVMLGEVMKDMLQEYVQEYKPTYWLFEGQGENKPYTSNSLRLIVKRAATSAGITQKVTTHTIRHCFATHLLESGTNIRLIQELLGHSDIKTTLIYTHVSQDSATSVISPLDSLSLRKNKKSKSRN